MAKFAVKNVSTTVVGIDVDNVQYTIIAGGVQAFDTTLEDLVQAAIYPFGSKLVVDYSGVFLPKGDYQEFYAPITKTDSALIAAVGAADGNRNAIRTSDGKITYFTNIEAQSLEPVIAANGLNISCDQTVADGIGLDWGLELLRSNSSFVAGTEKAYFKHKVTIDTVANCNLVMGLRKAEAFQKDFNDYDEMAALYLNAGELHIATILNDGATADTDTTDTISDADVVELYVENDQTIGLTMACAQVNEIKASLNIHFASILAHTTAADAVNVITAADATTEATLVVLINEIITNYDTHEGDAELAAAWLYHAAQETGDHSLASTTPVTVLADSIVMLADMKTKINAHIADVTTHGVATAALVVALASCTFFKYAINGAALAAPTTIAAFTFDAAEIMVPFVQFVHVTGAAGEVVIDDVDYNNK